MQSEKTKTLKKSFNNPFILSLLSCDGTPLTFSALLDHGIELECHTHSHSISAAVLKQT